MIENCVFGKNLNKILISLEAALLNSLAAFIMPHLSYALLWKKLNTLKSRS